MSDPRITFTLVAWLVLGGPVLPSHAASSDAIDTAAVQRQLHAARGAERIPLLIRLARAPEVEASAALRLADDALSLLAQHPSAADEARARLARSEALQKLGRYPAALEEARRAEQGVLEGRLDALLPEANYQLGRVHWRMADYAPALERAETARGLLAKRGASELMVRTLALIAAIHQARGDLDAALESDLAALRMSEAIGDEDAASRAHNNIGLVYWDLGKHAEALRELKRSLQIQERIGSRRNLPGTLNNIGLVLIELDRPLEAIPQLERALEMDRASGDLYGQAKEFSNLGFAQEKLHQPQRAIEFHRKALALRESIGDREGIVRSRGALGEIRLQQGDARGASAILEQSVALAHEIDDRRDEADHLELLSRARSALGDTAGALAAFRRYHEVLDALNDSTARRHAAELEARYRARERDRELAALQTLAEMRRRELRWLMLGSGLLALCLILLGVLHVLRGRAQRALAESEQRYRALFRDSLLPAYLVGVERGIVLDLNEAARALCGSPLGPLPIRLDALEPGWVRRALSRLVDADATGPLAIDDSWSEPSGRTRWTEVRGSSVAVDGRACRLVTVRDATELHAQEEIRQREEKLRSLGVLAGGIAHDFNNALTAIIGNLALARERSSSERPRFLELAEQAAVGAGRLTAQLLAFSRGGQPVRRNTDLGRLLRETVPLAGAGSHMRVLLEVPDDLWSAHVDAGQFGQVVSNLVINAQEATGEGGELRVRASNHLGDVGTGTGAGPARHVRIDFEDNGAGIPEGIRDRVFDPYFTTKSGGSGLGLATAFGICQRHGGTLSFVSRAGRGTTFSAFFPASAEAAAPPVPGSVVAPAGVGRILVLDDDPLVRGVLVRTLEQWGFSVEAVADGRDAVQRYVERLGGGDVFDLLIMDLTIPGGMGGRPALAEILRHDPHARAIVASGYSDDPVMAQHREAGFLAALAKPFQPQDLAAVVNAVLGRATPSTQGADRS